MEITTTRILQFLILLALLGSLHLAWAADVTVGTAKAAAGQKATGFIQVPAGLDAGTNIPVIVINGAKPGPKLAIVAGSHGTEHASIIALENLAQEINAADVFGNANCRPVDQSGVFRAESPTSQPRQW